MVVSCSACSEQYGVTEDVTFHKFPANEERRKKWLNAVQRENWTPGKRSMLCSKHFSPDKFVYKISGDKIRRYLMPDTIPTIFDRTGRKSKNGPSRRLGTSAEAATSDSNGSTDAATVELQMVQPGADILPADVALNPAGSLNLEILAATSVASEPFMITTKPELIRLSKDAPGSVGKPVETPAATSISVAGTSSNTLEGKVQSQEEKKLVHFPRVAKRAYHAIQIHSNLASLSKQRRRAYPGDFTQLNYNDVMEVSKSWTVLNNYIKKMRTNMKVLRQRNRRLEKRVTDLKSVVKFLKNRIVARDSAAVRLCGRSNLPVTTKRLLNDDQLCQVSNPLADHDYICVDEKSTS